jgi:long-subunit fatty acid transport protein
MKSSFLVLFFLISITSSFSQSGYFEDAYRFSQNKPAGSARIMGIGGTQWSLGGDVSNISGNPAGLGFFRSSEASITLGGSDWGVETSFLGQNRKYNTSNFSLPNLSFVLSSKKGPFNRGAFKGGGFGVSIQRIANFNTEYGYFSDQLGETSIIDFYLQDSFGIPENQIESFGLTGLAYSTYQINPIAFDADGNAINNPDTYDSFILGLPFQDETITQEGTANQITFAYGANFNHKFFVGGSLGIRSLNFNSLKVYNEEFIDEPLINSSVRENLLINGSGINVNLGLIYKPIEYVNLGFNFQSPTWYTLNEEYDASMSANYNNFYFEQEDVTLGSLQEVSDVFISRYNLNTPLKLGVGATFFAGKKGFISADLDWVDFSAARLNSNDFNEGPDNEAIRSTYTSTLNFRLGGEAKFGQFSLRGGYGYFGDPIANSTYDRSTQQISGGIGYRIKNFKIDLAIVNQNFNTLYTSYQVLDNTGGNIGPVTEIQNSITSGFLTLSLGF